MTRRDETVRLRHMLDHAREAVGFIHGLDREDLQSDRVLELALVRLLEIVSEAANRVPEGIRKNHPSIPWNQIIGLRNRLIHGYDSVDMDVLWQILKEDMPGLIAGLERAIGPESGE